jgi:hypothetical protein
MDTTAKNAADAKIEKEPKTSGCGCGCGCVPMKVRK